MADPRGAYLGSGKIYLAPYENPDNLQFIGNCSALNYEGEVNDIELQDYTAPGGGLDASVQRISALNITFDARHFNVGNMSRALFGTATDVTAGTASGEEHKAYPGAMIALKYPGGTNHVIKTTDTVPTTLVEGDDYVINAAGFIEITEGGEITDETDVIVDYSYAGHANIEALTAAGQRFRMVFIGLNEARSGKPVVIEAYKVGFSPAAIAPIGDDFGTMSFTGKCEKDLQRTTSVGVSEYLKIQDVT